MFKKKNYFVLLYKILKYLILYKNSIIIKRVEIMIFHLIRKNNFKIILFRLKKKKTSKNYIYLYALSYIINMTNKHHHHQITNNVQ